MILREPKVFVLAETMMANVNNIEDTLQAIGGDTAAKWLDSKVGVDLDGQFLNEFAGRACYMSYAVGLNPNVKQIREDTNKYFENILEKGDGSILEHSTVSFAFIDVSRVFTHELVRHRAGTAVSQESGRYRRLDEDHPLGFWEPDMSRFDKYLKSGETRPSLAVNATEIERMYLSNQNRYDWNRIPMNDKKTLTSWLRRILPNGMLNIIIWSANHRTLRHVITMRTSEFAEVEIRMVFDKVAQICKTEWPSLYQDFTQGPELPDKTHVWTPKYVKV